MEYLRNNLPRRAYTEDYPSKKTREEREEDGEEEREEEALIGGNRDGVTDSQVPEYNDEWIRQFFARYGITKLSHTTAARWLGFLGQSFHTRAKTYYVDRHEAEENVLDRQFYTHWIRDNKTRMYLWVHLSELELKDLEERSEGLKFPKPHCRFDKDGVTYFEFFLLDDVALLLPLAKERQQEGSLFICRLSVRKKAHERPVITIGQDEAIFNQ